jgi:hypothetical protein
MPTEGFIIAMFCRVDAILGDESKHPQAKLYPSEVATLALLYALKGVGERPFYRWLCRDYRHLFPALPERTRLFRLFAAHRAWADRFLAAPSVLGIADSYGIALRHPRRHGRTATQLGQKGLSNHRGIAGGKLCVLINQWGRIVAWADATANVHDSAFHPLIARFAGQSLVLTDGNFHRKAGDPANMKVCGRGTWPQRILVETVLSLLTRVCQLKRASHRVWTYFQAHLAFAVAVFNLLAAWDGLRPDAHGVTRLSLARFSL